MQLFSQFCVAGAGSTQKRLVSALYRRVEPGYFARLQGKEVGAARQPWNLGIQDDPSAGLG